MLDGVIHDVSLPMRGMTTWGILVRMSTSPTHKAVNGKPGNNRRTQGVYRVKASEPSYRATQCRAEQGWAKTAQRHEGYDEYGGRDGCSRSILHCDLLRCVSQQ